MKRIIVDTIYSRNGNAYAAQATLAINNDGSFYIDNYEYYNSCERVIIQGEDWDNDRIEKIFDVKIENNKIKRNN